MPRAVSMASWPSPHAAGLSGTALAALAAEVASAEEELFRRTVAAEEGREAERGAAVGIQVRRDCGCGEGTQADFVVLQSLAPLFRGFIRSSEFCRYHKRLKMPLAQGSSAEYVKAAKV